AQWPTLSRNSSEETTSFFMMRLHRLLMPAASTSQKYILRHVTEKAEMIMLTALCRKTNTTVSSRHCKLQTKCTKRILKTQRSSRGACRLRSWRKGEGTLSG